MANSVQIYVCCNCKQIAKSPHPNQNLIGIGGGGGFTGRHFMLSGVNWILGKWQTTRSVFVGHAQRRSHWAEIEGGKKTALRWKTPPSRGAKCKSTKTLGGSVYGASRSQKGLGDRVWWAVGHEFGASRRRRSACSSVRPVWTLQETFGGWGQLEEERILWELCSFFLSHNTLGGFLPASREAEKQWHQPHSVSVGRVTHWQTTLELGGWEENNRCRWTGQHKVLPLALMPTLKREKLLEKAQM